MWLIGILVLMTFSAGVVGLANRRGETVVLTAHWTYVHMGESYALIVGPLAGVSLAAAIFLASVTRATQSPSFVAVMATFLLSIIVLIGNGMMLATFRSAEKAGRSGPGTSGSPSARAIAASEMALGAAAPNPLGWTGTPRPRPNGAGETPEDRIRRENAAAPMRIQTPGGRDLGFGPA